ncbi:hypothetical protein D0Z00_003333 [Geotrichum galactomycetum]|uniref:Uncharacterized protein n=1 Tax=Geotrichum galactomycetum TaxID=27317 RepID=A0ACB6V1N1_9ASCO|nr:hypothetical protein D0Z00_003333 [Geotrichum candidum]
MRISPIILGLAAAGHVLSATISGTDFDVSKGTEVIPSDSKEAEAINAADKVPKFAPKDNTYNEDFDKSETFKKSEPKVSDQKIDIPDAEPAEDSPKKGAKGKTSSLQSSSSKPVATKEDAPVVVNDYDPNNLGVSSDGKTQASGHLEKTEKTEQSGDNSEEKTVGETKDDASISDPKKDDKKADTFGQTSKPKAVEKLHMQNDKDVMHAFLVSFSMTVMSEIGDKTFLIAAIMAMRHSRLTVISAASSALFVMTAISGVIGHALPAFLSRHVSSFIAGVLFLVFGFNLLREGIQMSSDQNVDEELEEVEAEINAAELNLQGEDLELGISGEKAAAIKRSASNPRISQDGLDNVAGDASLYRPRPRKTSAGGMTAFLEALNQITDGLGNLAALVLSPVWVQIFAMTFFAEWGDRSQITTIAMAAGSDYWFVIIGGIIAHFLCTTTAVIGGKMLATKITIKNVTLGGAIMFLFFSLIYFYEFFQG